MPIEFLQFTGLKDKNGKEIYEADIVAREGVGAKKENCEVVYENGRLLVGHNGTPLPERSRALYGYEVIGNIYETPESLKV